jgi:hypothetical protein
MCTRPLSHVTTLLGHSNILATYSNGENNFVGTLDMSYDVTESQLKFYALEVVCLVNIIQVFNKLPVKVTKAFKKKEINASKSLKEALSYIETFITIQVSLQLGNRFQGNLSTGKASSG